MMKMAATTKEILKQTSKAILFEEFNKDDRVPDLFTILQNNDPTTEMFQVELKKLEVHTFKEFLEKFAPKVYEICQQDEQGNIQFVYTSDFDVARKTSYRETSITDNVYYKMLSELYYKKGNSGSSNLEFNDKKILEMLSPKQEVEEARNIRKSLKYNLEKYYELTNRGENASGYASRFRSDRKKIRDKYKDSKIGLLPLAIEDVNIKLKLLDKRSDNNNNGADDVASKQISGYLDFNSNGDLVIQEVKEIDNLDSNDMAYVPDTVTKDGTTLPLTGVDWQVQGTSLVDDVLVPTSFKAVATYSGTGYYTAATGYVTTAEYTGTKYRELARAMGVEWVDQMSVEQYREAAIQAVSKLSQDVGIPTDLKGIVKEEDLSFLADSALADACMGGNPVAPTKEQVIALYKSLM